MDVNNNYEIENSGICGHTGHASEPSSKVNCSICWLPLFIPPNETNSNFTHYINYVPRSKRAQRIFRIGSRYCEIGPNGNFTVREANSSYENGQQQEQEDNGREAKRLLKLKQRNLSTIWSTKCGHMFHKPCLLEWIYVRTTDSSLDVIKHYCAFDCPVCRTRTHGNCLVVLYPTTDEELEYSYAIEAGNELQNQANRVVRAQNLFTMEEKYDSIKAFSSCILVFAVSVFLTILKIERDTEVLENEDNDWENLELVPLGYFWAIQAFLAFLIVLL